MKSVIVPNTNIVLIKAIIHSCSENFSAALSNRGKCTGAGNNGGQSCQRNLETICRAIRHLEGENTFDRIEEEIITDETIAVQDSTVGGLNDDGGNVSYDTPGATYIHHHDNAATTVYSNMLRRNPKHSAAADYHLTFSSPPSSPQHSPATTTIVYGMDKHMVGEPQEMPLELTTTHRISSPPHHHNHTTSSFPPHSTHPTPRPGVIVVKQA